MAEGGESKSGSPAPNEITGLPSLFSLFALAVTARVADGSILRFPKKEVLQMEKERVKLDRNIGGIKNMRSLPDVIFIIDPKKEDIAVGEAVKLGIPVKVESNQRW